MRVEVCILNSKNLGEGRGGHTCFKYKTQLTKGPMFSSLIICYIKVALSIKLKYLKFRSFILNFPILVVHDREILHRKCPSTPFINFF